MKLGLKELLVLVRDMTDDEVVILTVDSNTQRENLLPSEEAFAYKMKLEAMKHQGKRTDLTSGQVGPKLAVDEISKEANESQRQIKLYIKMNIEIDFYSHLPYNNTNRLIGGSYGS